MNSRRSDLSSALPIVVLHAKTFHNQVDFSLDVRGVAVPVEKAIVSPYVFKHKQKILPHFVGEGAILAKRQPKVKCDVSKLNF